MQHVKGQSGRKSNMLNDGQRFHVYKWLESIGQEQAWKLTALELASRFSGQSAFCATEKNMLTARNVVFPRPKVVNPVDRVAELEKRIAELEQRFILK